jgi:hypothetical protein
MTKINTEPPLEIPAYAIKVYWDDTPVNYSKEGKVLRLGIILQQIWSK